MPYTVAGRVDPTLLKGYDWISSMKFVAHARPKRGLGP